LHGPFLSLILFVISEIASTGGTLFVSGRYHGSAKFTGKIKILLKMILFV